MLLCTVRGCRGRLSKDAGRLVCPRGHSFDIARSGYVNLLQPQDRRSRQPGDTAAAIAARRRVHELAITQPLLRAIIELTEPRAEDVVLDAGCGEGFYPGSLAASSGCEAHGIDISIPVIDAAARRYPGCEWVVANADRFVPYEDGAFSLLLSITARLNPPEFRRVIRPHGRLLVALPAADDLTELRGRGRDRRARTIAEFAPHFRILQQRRATTSAEVEADVIEGILHSIYRPMSRPPAERRRITLSLDLLLLTPA